MHSRTPATVCALVTALVLQGCSTIYRYDVAGNLTCVDPGILNTSTLTVPPPYIRGSDKVFGCPARVSVKIEAPDAASSVRWEADFKPNVPVPTTSLSDKGDSFSAQLDKGRTLYVKAITVDQCGAASEVVNRRFTCTGDTLTTPRVSHWYDFIVFGKKPYDDVIFEGAELPQGCVVADIHVELLNPDGSVFDYTTPTYDEVTDGHTGVRLTSQTLNSSRLEVTINSWHYFGSRVRYDVVYFVRGTNCVLPPFSYRTL